MAVFTHPCGEGLGVLLLVAEGAGLGLGAGLEPGVGVDPELEPLAVDVVRQRLDPVRERPLVGHQVALRRPAQAQGKLVSYTTYQLPPSGKW